MSTKMNCEDAKLKVQALADNELPEEEIGPVINHIESCYTCRDEYISLLKLKKRLNALHMDIPEPEKTWFEKLQKKPFHRFSSGFGMVLFLGSYLVLIGYALYDFFTTGGEGPIVKIITAVILLSVFLLLGNAIYDRIQESKTDKYKGVIK